MCVVFGFPFSLPVQVLSKLENAPGQIGGPSLLSIQQIVEHLMKLDNPDRLADLVSCTLLSKPAERQTILETPNLERRLKHLVHFLIREVQRNSKTKKQ